MAKKKVLTKARKQAIENGLIFATISVTLFTLVVYASYKLSNGKIVL